MPKYEQVKNLEVSSQLSGKEGLAVAVIEKALQDIKYNNINGHSAIKFFKNDQKFLEFWLSLASKKIDLKSCTQKLYALAVTAESNYSTSIQDAKSFAIKIAKKKKTITAPSNTRDSID